MSKKTHVHFMGIGGSGMAPIAVIAKQAGFEVSGCDCNIDGYYSEELKANGIPIQLGHSCEHLENADILAVTPAVFAINPDHPELLEGQKRNMVMTWQEFMGRFLQEDKYVVAVSGTHGKSTTTILTGLALEAGGFDPIVEAGTIYRPWGGGFRLADSKYFVCEADEFNRNFLNYSPSIAIINNIEMDHPEYFKDFEDFKDAFKGFIQNMNRQGTLVVNEDSEGIQELLLELRPWLEENQMNVIGFTLGDGFDYPFHKHYQAKILQHDKENVFFQVQEKETTYSFTLGMIGAYNVANSLGVICAGLEMGIAVETLQTVCKNYRGIGRRTELVADINDIRIYDDYGHHPTSIAMVLESFKTAFPERKIYAIVEPHQISRVKLFPNEYIHALEIADESIITKTYLGREIHKNLEPVDLNHLVSQVKTKTASYIEDFNVVADTIASKVKPGDTVIIFGAGNSYKFAELLKVRLKQ